MFHDPRHPGDPAASKHPLAAMSRFTLTETEIGNGCREIKVEGELDLSVSDQLQHAIDACLSDQILISLESCQFIDSAGLAVLVRAHRDAGSRVVAHSPSAQVLRVLEITGLTADGLVFPDREQALSQSPGLSAHNSGPCGASRGHEAGR
jgi:anti-anti-sigma factor